MISNENQYTPSGLIHWMNHKYKKTNGKVFEMRDIQQYIRHGRIPLKYGNYKIQKTRDNRQKMTILTLIKEN